MGRENDPCTGEKHLRTHAITDPQVDPHPDPDPHPQVDGPTPMLGVNRAAILLTRNELITPANLFYV